MSKGLLVFVGVVSSIALIITAGNYFRDYNHYKDRESMNVMQYETFKAEDVSKDPKVIEYCNKVKLFAPSIMKDRQNFVHIDKIDIKLNDFIKEHNLERNQKRIISLMAHDAYRYSYLKDDIENISEAFGQTYYLKCITSK